MGLKWEFPGGKIEPGETAEQALARELDEELGIVAVIGPRVAQLRHRYSNGGAIDLQFFAVRDFSGEIANRIFNEIRWSTLQALPTFDFLAADLNLIRDLADGKLLDRSTAADLVRHQHKRENDDDACGQPRNDVEPR